MKLKYENQTIDITTTTNKTIMKNKIQKLYYAILIRNCNHYSSIANRQRIDVVMTDQNLQILAIKNNMHENTVFTTETATTTIILPPNSIKNLKIGKKFTLE